MPTRHLSDEWLNNTPGFIASIADDWDLQPEIRDNSITVYYRGLPLFRDIRIEDGTITCSVNYECVPVHRPANHHVSFVFDDEAGFQFQNAPDAVALGKLEADVVDEYKRMAWSISQTPNCETVHRLVVTERPKPATDGRLKTCHI